MISWTNNAALCIAKWFTSEQGMNLAWADLDEDSVIAAANVCDERVRVASTSGITFNADPATDELTATTDGARNLDVGDGITVTSTSGTLPAGLVLDGVYYVIPGTGGTFKLASTVANALAGTAINITTAGSGTHTFDYYDEARYKLNGSFTLDAAKGDVLQQLLSAMAGVAVYIGGKWFLHAGTAALPTVTLTEDDLRGDFTYEPKRSMRDRFNGVRAVYVNPDANWQPVDAPPMQSATYLAEDDGEELFEDIRFPFTTSTRGVQRLQKIALERNRRQGIVQFPAKLTAMRLQPWDGVYIRNARYKWERKQFRVIGWVLAEDGGIDLTLQEDDANVYAWTSSEERDTAVQQGVVLPDASAIQPPAALTVNTPTALAFSRLFVEWTEVASIWIAAYDLEHRAKGITDWTSYGRITVTASRKAVVERSVPTDFRIRSVAEGGGPSAWLENLAPGPPTDVAMHLDMDPPGLGIIEWVNDAACVTVQLFKDGAIFNESIDGTDESIGGLNDGSYQLRSVSETGNISALTDAVIVTGVGSGEGGGDGGDGGGGDGDGE